MDRSREGAWIEISVSKGHAGASYVAPARERGLKSYRQCRNRQKLCRSRKGAWIEIRQVTIRNEIRKVAPVRERGLKCPYVKYILIFYLSLP